ncbi:Lrp/AsnC family transcriptional regulator [Paenibacillus chitinolyticus]|uniref:Lrp/AsnC family transcriptional regulator n=1 Tax=Paenibacillus chitinolyticus TaxID=79263 RepID=UPI001C4497E9|nr:AsnC family transcriptional regulator [Paenibacillus chitinolyticus]MBV6716450.1 winged helix-turn-helix transcriptional regulator [Paenibacillus chitinolyticus]
MDSIDIKINRLLEENGRLSHEEISKCLHISRPAVHQRVAKLEKNGIIKGYRGIVDWSLRFTRFKKLPRRSFCLPYMKMGGKKIESAVFCLDRKGARI